MIAFDNGPADGDYVRYIDELMARAAADVKAHPEAGTLGPRPETARAATTPAIRSGASGSVLERTLDAIRRVDGSVVRPPAVPTRNVTPANSGRVDAGPELSPRTRAVLIALMLGLLLMVVGFVLVPASPFFVLAGFVVAVLAGRGLLRTAVARRPPRQKG